MWESGLTCLGEGANASLMEYKRNAAIRALNQLWNEPFWVLALLLAGSSGCDTFTASQGMARSVFITYDCVAIMSRMDPKYDDVFLPAWMNAFPRQTLVEQRDLTAILDAPHLPPDQLDAAMRAKLRGMLGVKAIVSPSLMPAAGDSRVQMEIKVIDTETGQIVASALSRGSDRNADALVEKAVAALRSKAASAR